MRGPGDEPYDRHHVLSSMVAEQQAGDAAETEQKRLAFCRWTRFTADALAAAESLLFSGVRSRITSQFIPVRMGQVYTVTAQSSTASSARIPVVLIHGFAGGVGLWAANIDAVAKSRTAYCFDLLGFGRSSRPVFAKDPALIELQYVQSIDDWRKEMGINKMILIGHSFGAYLAASYALEKPQRVRHLVLVDPWGFPEKPPEAPRQQSYPTWMRAAVRAITFFNPLTALRVAGPYGVTLIKKLRPDLSLRYGCANPDAIYEYIYQCNAQKPSGEAAFNNMSFSFGWARRPMLGRIIDLPPDVPMTFIYGSKSWIDSASGVEVQEERPDAYVDVQVINGAGHHVYVDQKDVFNGVLSDLFSKIDANEDIVLKEEADEQEIASKPKHLFSFSDM